jgi:hypothetical protein
MKSKMKSKSFKPRKDSWQKSWDAGRDDVRRKGSK